MLISLGCAPSGGDPPGGGSGGAVAPEPTDCGAQEALSLEIGEGVGSAFFPFVEGDPLPLEFASQAGLEAAVSLKTTGVLPEDIKTLEIELVVEDAPIGASTISSLAVRCQGEEAGRVDTSIPIDVTSHPTVASVAQLDDVPAVLSVKILGEDGVLIEASVEVILAP